MFTFLIQVYVLSFRTWKAALVTVDCHVECVIAFACVRFVYVDFVSVTCSMMMIMMTVIIIIIIKME